MPSGPRLHSGVLVHTQGFERVNGAQAKLSSMFPSQCKLRGAVWLILRYPRAWDNLVEPHHDVIV